MNQGILFQAEGESEALQALEKRLVWLKALSDTANGDVQGKERIMLETYVQTSFFDRMIARANTRFLLMSGGQYDLKRREDANRPTDRREKRPKRRQSYRDSLSSEIPREGTSCGIVKLHKKSEQKNRNIHRPA